MTETVETVQIPDPLDGDPRVREYLGSAWDAVQGFAGLLRKHGVERGLLGPNEAGRLWERHLLNSAGVVSLLAASGAVVDLGSGGGLPGIVVAAMRPEAHVVLLEPMERRTEWLRFVVGELGLTNTEVMRGRADDVVGAVHAEAVTARAVSGLDNLYRWAAPLVRPGGALFAIKGARALDEVAAAASAARRRGWVDVEVKEVATVAGVEPTRVVCAVRAGGGAGVR